jgi:hypothetical protein
MTVLPSAEKPGCTQHPPFVNCANCAAGSGVAMGACVGDGVAVAGVARVAVATIVTGTAAAGFAVAVAGVAAPAGAAEQPARPITNKIKGSCFMMNQKRLEIGQWRNTNSNPQSPPNANPAAMYH